MEGSDQLKDIDIEIKNCTWYSFDDIIKIEDFHLNNYLIDENLYKNILVSNISYITLIGAKSLRVRYDKVHAFIRVCDENRFQYFWRCKYDFIWNKIRYLTGRKSGIIYVIFHNHSKSKLILTVLCPQIKKLTFHHVIILIKPVFNKYKLNATETYS